MPTIGVIAEGPTDQTVIENILLGYFEGSAEAQPEDFRRHIERGVSKTGRGS